MSYSACPTCDAELPASEIASGWCEGCGKRLPSLTSRGSPAKGSASAYAADRGDKNKITFGYILTLFVCLTISITAAVLAWGSGSFSMAVGGGVGGGISVVIGRMLGVLPRPEAD